MLRNSTLLLLFLLPWIAIAHEPESRPALGHFSLRRAALPDDQICSLETCGRGAQDGQCGRELSPRALGAPDPTSKPAAGHWYSPKHYGGNVDTFFRGEIARQAYITANVVPMTSPITSNYQRLKDEPRTMTMTGLCGCVGILVVSRSAIWMAHVYENMIIEKQGELAPRIVEWLSDGQQIAVNRYGLKVVSGGKKKFFAPDQHPAAFIFAPETDGFGFLYQDVLKTIHRMVEDLVGVKSTWVGYKPRRIGKLIDRYDYTCTRSDGKVLVQYQPSNYGLGFIRTRAKLRVWFEGGRWKYEKTWAPHKDQRRS